MELAYNLLANKRGQRLGQGPGRGSEPNPHILQDESWAIGEESACR